jgi:hypothetical protein
MGLEILEILEILEEQNRIFLAKFLLSLHLLKANVESASISIFICPMAWSWACSSGQFSAHHEVHYFNIIHNIPNFFEINVN